MVEITLTIDELNIIYKVMGSTSKNHRREKAELDMDEENHFMKIYDTFHKELKKH